MRSRFLYQFTIAVVALLATALATAAPIKVLLARSNSSVSTSVVINALMQANQTMGNSGLGSRDFVSAATVAGAPLVFTANCNQSDSQALLACAKTNLGALRNQYSADIVVMVVPSMFLCGAVPASMINATTISAANENNGYAVVKQSCMTMPSFNMKVASHEIGHLLSLEHHNGDPATALPLGYPYNHAEEDYDDLTVMGNEVGLFVGDCPLTSCLINDFFSEVGKTFPDGGSAGHPTRSNAKKVVKDKSWNVVAAYRPLPPPQACNLNWEYIGCNGRYSVLVTASLPGYTVLNADYDYRTGSGSWRDLYEGGLTCPGLWPSVLTQVRALLTTAYGISQCTIYVRPQNCDNEPW